MREKQLLNIICDIAQVVFANNKQKFNSFLNQYDIYYCDALMEYKFYD